MIVAAFIAHKDDWILPHKLRVLSSLTDRIFVALDRSPESFAICDRFPKVEAFECDSDIADLGMTRDGPAWSEGRLRQAVWDRATKCSPRYVLLGDADEIPTPHMAQWLLEGFGSEDYVDCWYADWVNLIFDAAHAIGGIKSVWSYQVKFSNKKAQLVRYDRKQKYRYDTRATRHCRMEPNPLAKGHAILDATHRMGPVPMVHYKWANWPRWLSLEDTKLPFWKEWPAPDAKIVDVPPHWLWRWDADDLIRRMPENVIVIGNGPHGEIPEGYTIRFNNFVGRADLWVVNCWDDLKLREWPGDMLSITTDAEQPKRTAKWLGMYPHMHVPKESWTEPARAIKRHNPSTGITMLHRLARAGKRIDAYGFTGVLPGGSTPSPSEHGDERGALSALAEMGVRFHASKD